MLVMPVSQKSILILRRCFFNELQIAGPCELPYFFVKHKWSLRSLVQIAVSFGDFASLDGVASRLALCTAT